MATLTKVKLDSKILTAFKKSPMLRPKELSAKGISRTKLAEYCRMGLIQRLGRGIYSLPGAIQSEHQSLAEVSTWVPNGIICLLSALHFHNIGTQLPREIWLAVDRKSRTPRMETIILKVVRFSPRSLKFGVEVVRIEGIPVRVTSVAKTIADCFKFRNKIGMETVLEALREGWKSRRFKMDDLHRASKINRVARIIRPYLESLV
jgi:predicted transcriptional regulator of viral defense system